MTHGVKSCFEVDEEEESGATFSNSPLARIHQRSGAGMRTATRMKPYCPVRIG